MKIVAIVQARVGSTRLTGKVLFPLAEKPLLVRMVERVSRATRIDEVVVATSVNREDDQIQELCLQNNYPCFRGDALDLLDRHYQAARKSGADVVLKIPSDCPLIDPVIIEQVISCYLENPVAYDYVSNLHPATFPDGNDVELMTYTVLEKAWSEATLPLEREHTTPFIWEHPERFRIGNVTWKTGLDYSMSHRWTIDYVEDYLFINEVFETLHRQRPDFTLYDILDLIEEYPHLKDVNKKYNGVNWYRNHLNELKTIKAEQTRQVSL